MNLKKLIVNILIATIIAVSFVQLIEIEKVSGYIGYLLGISSCGLFVGIRNLIEDIFDGE
jgi:hypothetical protein